MSVSPINSTPLFSSNNNSLHQQIASVEQQEAFEASLGAASETINQNVPSQPTAEVPIPKESWDAFWKGFNHSLFEHDRREFAYYDQKRKEIDYGNKT